jgi:hypothetical protein
MQKEFDELTLKLMHMNEDEATFAKRVWRLQLFISVPDGGDRVSVKSNPQSMAFYCH